MRANPYPFHAQLYRVEWRRRSLRDDWSAWSPLATGRTLAGARSMIATSRAMDAQDSGNGLRSPWKQTQYRIVEM